MTRVVILNFVKTRLDCINAALVLCEKANAFLHGWRGNIISVFIAIQLPVISSKAEGVTVTSTGKGEAAGGDEWMNVLVKRIKWRGKQYRTKNVQNFQSSQLIHFQKEISLGQYFMVIGTGNITRYKA